MEALPLDNSVSFLFWLFIFEAWRGSTCSFSADPLQMGHGRFVPRTEKEKTCLMRCNQYFVRHVPQKTCPQGSFDDDDEEGRKEVREKKSKQNNE